MNKPPTIWRLKSGLERKFAKGHPWVFSSDLDQSPKGHTPGDPVELRSSTDTFLAFGYGHPGTLIAFRTLTRSPLTSDGELALLKRRLASAAQIRSASGVDRLSHRLVFAEAEGLPGFIVDRYLVLEPLRQVFVVQSSTAGGDRLLPLLKTALVDFPGRELAFGGRGGLIPSALVLALDASGRALEGLAKEPRSVEGDWSGLEPQRTPIAVQAAGRGEVLYDVDFVGGQKTGFFLDQRVNIRRSWPLLERLVESARLTGKPLRVLDLFCYVGQWSVQIAKLCQETGTRAEFSLLDASAAALELAQFNTRRAHSAAEISAKKLDILAAINQLPVAAYDVVICDPPAFIKKRKDHPTGLAAYGKLNREAIKRVAPGGVFISCSCSGLLQDEEFTDMLAGAKRTSGRDLVWLADGGHGEDHPFVSEFPQGRYLKAWMGVVDSRQS